MAEGRVQPLTARRQARSIVEGLANTEPRPVPVWIKLLAL